MIGSTAEPTGGIPSLTDSEIVQLYQQYLHRSPDGTELASERENALKYSAAGIERQIANRAGNTAGSGIRGDEGLAPLTVPYVPPAPVAVPPSQVGNVVSMGPSAIQPGPSSSGPTGTLTGYYGSAYGPIPNYGPGAPSPSFVGGSSAAAGPLGLSWEMWLILGAAAVAAWYFLVKK